MSWDRVESNWAEAAERIRKKWDRLDDADMAAIKGQRNELAARIQARYAVDKEAAEKQLDDWMREPGALDDWNDSRPILDM